MEIINDTKFRPDIKRWKQLCDIWEVYPDTIMIVNAKEASYRGMYYIIGASEIICIWGTPYETNGSIDWLFFHEYRHLFVAHHKPLDKFLTKKDSLFIDKINSLKKTNKQKLKLFFSPSEIDADVWATQIVGRDYGEIWHKKRQKKRKVKNENH